MKKVCLFNFPAISQFHGYQIDTFDPLGYFGKYDHWDWNDLIIWGINGFFKRRGLTAHAEAVDQLYRERDPAYMRMIGDFVERFRDYDLVVMSTYNFIHPEVLHHELKKPIKILGFIDDPLSTYMRGVPYLWAFDSALYISPSYDERTLFPDALNKWGCAAHHWFPLAPYRVERLDMSEQFFAQRDLDVIYVGNHTRSKVDRLIRLKKHFGNRFHVHGRWPFKGYAGIVRGLFGKPVSPYRVTSISNEERAKLYYRTKIGFNMHVSDRPMETGNMRMYEVPAHGAMLLCDKAGSNANEQIFTSGVEAVYYDSIGDAIEKAEYYIAHSEERIAIARAGCERVWRDYEWDTNVLRFLEWAFSLRNRQFGAVDSHEGL